MNTKMLTRGYTQDILHRAKEVATSKTRHKNLFTQIKSRCRSWTHKDMELTL